MVHSVRVTVKARVRDLSALSAINVQEVAVPGEHGTSLCFVRANVYVSLYFVGKVRASYMGLHTGVLAMTFPQLQLQH